MNTFAKVSLIAISALCTSVASANMSYSGHLILADNAVHEKDNSDTGITTKIKSLFISEKLFGSADISAVTIKVITNNGVVNLSGTADNQLQIDNAIKMSQSVDGVNKVVNEVTIKNK